MARQAQKPSALTQVSRRNLIIKTSCGKPSLRGSTCQLLTLPPLGVSCRGTRCPYFCATLKRRLEHTTTWKQNGIL
jgi:hypothetical protein